MQYNKKQLATKLARQQYWYVSEVYKQAKTFWEHYASDSIEHGSHAKPDFCGWTAIVPATIYAEFLKKAKWMTFDALII